MTHSREFTWQVIVLAVGVLLLLLAIFACTPVVIETPLDDPPTQKKSIEKNQPVRKT